MQLQKKKKKSYDKVIVTDDDDRDEVPCWLYLKLGVQFLCVSLNDEPHLPARALSLRNFYRQTISRQKKESISFPDCPSVATFTVYRKQRNSSTGTNMGFCITTIRYTGYASLQDIFFSEVWVILSVLR